MYETRALPVLEQLLGSVGWHDAPLDRLEISDTSLSLATEWPVTANALAALAAVGLAASHLHELRSGERRPVRLDTRQAGLAMASSSYLAVNGRNAKFRDPFTRFYPAADGEWVFLHGNFPHLQAGLLKCLGVETAGEVEAATRRRKAADIEEAAIEAGLCAARVRTRAQWREEEQARALQALPLLDLQPIAPADPRPRGAHTEPLGRLRMLDFSRVIAGPMAGRTMAEFGADVLLVSGPSLPSISSLVIDTGFGKRASEIDLKSEAGRRKALELGAGADVVLDAYRPGALAGLGLSREDFARASPGLVHVALDAFGACGPWHGRRGYDSLVQATAGMCWDGRGGPRNLPCQPLDYLTGYLASFGAMLGVIRQMNEGGSWSLRLSLARTAQWMWDTFDQLGPETAAPARNPSAEEVVHLFQNYCTTFGNVSALKPALQTQDWRWKVLPVPLAANGAEWAQSNR